MGERGRESCLDFCLSPSCHAPPLPLTKPESKGLAPRHLEQHRRSHGKDLGQTGQGPGLGALTRAIDTFSKSHLPSNNECLTLP